MGRHRSTPWVLGGLAVAAFALRAANFLEVFPGRGRVVLPGNDPYFHLRRILLTIRDYPEVPFFDGAMNFPAGAPVIWPPGFDLFIATICRVLGLGGDRPFAVEAVAAVLVPVIGALTILPVYFMGRRLFDRPTALCGAALLALSPSHLWYSRLGFVDHHAAATLIQSVALLLLLGAVLRPGRARTAGLALILTTGMLVWNGFVVFVALVDLACLVLLLRGDAGRRQRIGDLLWQTQLPAALLVAPVALATVSRTGEPLGWTALSWTHVLALLAGGLLGLGIRFRRLAIPAGAVLLVLLVTALWGADLKGGLGWVLSSDPFMAQVDESMPLLRLARDPGGPGVRLSIPRNLTLLHFVFPVAWILLWVRERRHGGPGGVTRNLLAWSGALFALALLQRRFMEALAPTLALLIAWLLIELYRAVRPRSALAAVAAVALITTGAFAPWYAGWLAGSRVADSEYDARLYDALESFRGKVLRTEDRAAPGSDPPREGAINPWPLGHKILYLTGLPVVSNNFGSHIGADSYRDWSEFFLASDEDLAAELLARRRVRYVIVDYDLEAFKAAIHALGREESDYFGWRRGEDGQVLTVARRPFLESMFYRLNVLLGSRIDAMDLEQGRISIPGLGRFRLVHDAARRGRGWIRVFEHVPGAQLSVTCDPGDGLELVYRFTSGAGAQHRYRRTATCNGSGAASWLLPYPSDRPDLGLESRYVLRSSRGSAEVFVPDAEVMRGGTVEVRLRRPPSHPTATAGRSG